MKYETMLKAGTFMLVVHATPDEVTRAQAILIAEGALDARLHLADAAVVLI